MLQFISLFLVFNSLFYVSPAYRFKVTLPNKTENKIIDPEICRMFGSVYLTSDPKEKSLARYIIYIEPEAAYADIQVFKENNKLFADGPGLWYLTSGRNFADHIFFVTTNRAFADFSVHYTKARTFAGCRN